MCCVFSTPIYDAAGNFQGILILSLDLKALRDTMSLFSSPDAPINGGEETRVRSLFSTGTAGCSSSPKAWTRIPAKAS